MEFNEEMLNESGEIVEENDFEDVRAQRRALRMRINQKLKKETQRKTCRDVQNFKAWLAEKNESREIPDIPPSCLDVLISEYFFSLKKRDGTQYEPSTLTSIFGSLRRYLEGDNYGVDLGTSHLFNMSRKVIAAKKKELINQGYGNLPNKSDGLTEADEERLWQSGALGTNNPWALRNAVWYLTTKFIGYRGRQEMRQLKIGDLKICKDADGVEYVEFTERTRKVRQGGTIGLRPFAPRMWCNTENVSRCPVAILRKFLGQRPADTLAPECPLLLCINHKRDASNLVWYTRTPMGINEISRIMPVMAKHAALAGKVTNRSVRRTCPNLLRRAPPLAGQRSSSSSPHGPVASMDEQRQMIIDILTDEASAVQEPKRRKSSPAPAVVSTSEIQHNVQSSSENASVPIEDRSSEVNSSDHCCSRTEMATGKEAVVSAAKGLINFINKSPSPFHAVDECRRRLVAAGFREIREQEHWEIKPKDKLFVTRNQSSIIAFAVGGNYRPGNGFSMVGAHTDSPCLKVKPVSRRIKEGYIQVGVETYGGGTWHTWFDRDLKVAGRVIVKEGSNLVHRLVHVERPILRLPNVAIHLHREMGQKFEFNKESHFSPVLATVATAELQQGCTTEDDKAKCHADKHHPVLIKLLAEELEIKPEDILDFELCLADCQDAAIGGAFREFIFAPRLDNLISTYTAMEGLIKSCDNEAFTSDPNIRLVCCFDNEEVGSQSAQGAGSTWMELITRRLAASDGNSTSFEEAIPKSVMLSCDVAHSVHPNYSDKHEEKHRPHLHKGMTIKFNANQRYATTAITTALLRDIAAKANLPLQDFVVRQDMPCGSTIGPIMSAKMGLATVDIGPPLLSMHSIREMVGTSSVLQCIQLFEAFFENYPETFASVQF